MTEEQRNSQNNDSEDRQESRDNQFVEEIEVQSNQLVERVQEIIKEGNVRRLIIRTHEDRVLLDTPLTVGLGVGGVLAWFGGIPIIVIAGIAAAFTRVKIEIVREVTGGNDVVRGHKQEVEIDVDDE
jgi:hypothetical protein